MAKTHQVLTFPAPGTKVKPVFIYDDEQRAKLNALKEVRLFSLLKGTTDHEITVCLESGPSRTRPVPQVGIAVAESAGHDAAIYASREMGFGKREEED